MDEKFYSCYNNFKKRAKEYVIKPIFYFEKTKLKFNKLNMSFIIEKNKYNKHQTSEELKKIGKIL